MEEVSELGNCVVSVDDRDDKCKVSLVDVTAKWDKNDAINTIKNVSLDVKSGELCGIIGSVGSGKSSLLAVILGEVSTTCGKVSKSFVSIAYPSARSLILGQDKWSIELCISRSIRLFRLCSSQHSVWTAL